MLYVVTYGTISERIEADSENDAWCAFCSLHEEALKHPNAAPRTIEPADPVAEPVTEPVVETAPSGN